MSETAFKIQAYNKTQLSRFYKVSVWTFNKWLKPISSELGEYKTRCYMPAQVEIIVKFLGMP